MSKARYTEHVLQILIKQSILECIQQIPAEMLCYDSVSIVTAGVYWTTWWSPKKYHIQTIMIQMNSHGHGIYLLVLINFFQSALKCYFISKATRGYWHILYIICYSTLITPAQLHLLQSPAMKVDLHFLFLPYTVHVQFSWIALIICKKQKKTVKLLTTL